MDSASLRVSGILGLAQGGIACDAAHFGTDFVQFLRCKRDDCIGLAMSGNKVRKLEFSLAAAQAAGADCVVSGGVTQSNMARQVAGACAKLGLECHLGIMHGRPGTTEPAYNTSGNILLNRLFGSVIHDILWDEDRNRHLESIASELSATGRRVFLVPYGASDALGAVGYVIAAEEIVRSCPEAVFIVHASGSGGTQTRLLTALLALNHKSRVIGVDVDAQAARVERDVRRTGQKTATLLGIQDRWVEERVEVVGDWCGPAYGELDARTEDAIRLAARLEGLALDPVYSGKAMAALLGLARQGRFRDVGPLVWIHTGGDPGLFAYPATITRLAGNAVPNESSR